MNALRHFSILILALCCTYFADAQCPTSFTDTVRGNNISVNVSANYTGFSFAWYLDGTMVQGANPNYSYVYQNVLAGSHRLCMYTYSNNTHFCDSVCQTVNVTSCGTLTAQWTSSVGTNDTVRFVAYDTNSIAHHGWSFGDGTSGSGTTATHVYSAPGSYHVCFYAYIPGSICVDSLCETVVVPQSSTCGVAAFATYILNDSTIRGYSTSTGVNDSTVYVWNIYNNNGTLLHTINTNHTNNLLTGGMPMGTYRVCLSLYNGQNTFCDSACNSVSVYRCSSLNAAYFHTSSTSSDTLRVTVPTNNPPGTTYAWTFGDATTSTATRVTHVYTHAGTYTVCLVVSNPALTCRDTVCQSITVGTTACGVAALSYYVVGDTSIHAYSTSTGVDTNSIYAWIIRNSSGAIVASHDGRNVTYITTAGLPVGTYTVCEFLYNSNQLLCDSACSTVVLSNCSGLTAAWTYTISHDTVTYLAADTNSHATHYWSFGDGTTGSGTHAVHVYPNYGTYHVCFYDYIAGTTCVDSVCGTIHITAPVTCGTPAFTYYILNDTSIHAYSTSTGTDSTYYYGWTLKGANNTMLQSQVGHTSYFITHHVTPGVYTVCLTLYHGSAFCDSVCNTVVVPLIGACGTPGFRDTVYAGIGGGAIHAYTTSTSVDSVSQYSWKIWGPHGLVQVFTGAEFTSATLDTGTYTVCQYIRATGTTRICDSLCQTVIVGGGSNPCAGLSAAWSYNLQSNSTDSIEFHGANDPSGTYYRWSFGDGTYNYGQNIKHGYAQAGTYTVCLVVFNNLNTCRDTVCQNVVITTTTPCPIAAFAQYVYSDSMIHAYSSSTGTTTNTVYAWHVTNAAGVVVQTETSTGTTASLLTHGLPNGTYNVCLFVYANTHTFCDSICHTITIADTIHPCAGLNATFTTNHLSNGNVQLIPADTAAGVSHYWHFGDGTVSTNNDPVHAYTSPGLYHVCQYVYYAGSTCVDSFCTNVQANASGCNAGFTAQGYYPPYNGVHFTSTSTSTDSIIAYRWTFGDNTTATFANGNHVFPHSGKWYVCLLIYSAHGCTSTHCDSVNVDYDPCYGLSANYTYTYTQGGGVHFAGSTNITSVHNLWTFGDGTTATTFDPTHYYTQAGTYRVCHIVSIPGTLCADTSCETIQGTGIGSGCHANFTDSAIANISTILFTNHSTSTDSIVSYVWNFGDGSSSTSSNTHHTYTASGSVFYVCLTITTASGCSNTYCDSVHVGHPSTDPCHASFNYTVDSCQVITFTSTSTGPLSFLRWIYGDGTTDTLSHPTHVYAQGGNYTVILHFYGTNCYNFDTAVIAVPACTSLGDTVCGVVFNDLNGNGVQNGNEPGIANAEIHVGSYTTHADSNGHYVIVVPPGVYNIYYCAPTGYSFTIPVHIPLNTNSNCTAYQSIQINSGSNCGYNFGIQVNTVTICGTVYFDGNNNHVQDPGESGIANSQVVFTDAGHVVYTAYTDQYGHYCAVVPVGNYTLTTTVTNYPHGIVTPGSITVAATTAGSSYENNNFGVYVTPNTAGCDLSIHVTPNTTVTPGYPAWYQIEVCNVGSNITNGNVNLFYDPSLRYNYSSPAATSQNPTTYTATWHLAGLNPGSCQYYYVSLTADSTLTAGQFIFTLANVTTDGCTDLNQGNNVDTVHQNVTSSWDPNNKEVSPIGLGPDHLVNGDQWLTYTINFQNTGSAPAINIVIQDTLSQYLDISTFKMVGASLPYTMQFAGNEAIWKFNAVSLPDSSTDQQASHGFVSFMIMPLPNLPSKTRITNQADIFFDYNAGVVTNSTLNTIDYSLSVSQLTADNVTITLQPNPFNQYTTIKVDGSEGPYELNVFDMLGRVVKNQPAAGNVFSLERGNIASGMYMYEVLHNGVLIGKGKMIAQ